MHADAATTLEVRRGPSDAEYSGSQPVGRIAQDFSDGAFEDSDCGEGFHGPPPRSRPSTIHYQEFS
jgi:hypothetical protein